MEQQITHIKNWLGSGSINIFGHPFAGKDTQADILIELLDAELIAGGDILRSYHDQELIKRLMSTGDLFPTDLYLQIVLPYLSRNEIASKPLILSSVGRMKGEEQVILQATHDSGHPTKAVVLLKLSDEEVWKRFEVSQQSHDRGQRQDDNADALKVRLEKFKNETMPVIEFYRDSGLLIEVDGTQSRGEVTDSILTSLYAIANR